MKRAERLALIVKILTDSPCKDFSLGFFCEMFGAAKSSISEDLHMAAGILRQTEMGDIITTSGAGGGVRYVPGISNEAVKALQQEVCTRLNDKSRILGGGFLYTSDIMCDPNFAKRVGYTFARKFYDLGANYVATIETKGIPVALMTAQALNLPLVIIRRETKISEGSTISINYFSGSYDHVQKMSISKRAVAPGSRALIIDDFMRGGGSIKGIAEILSEFDVKVAATGVVIASAKPEKKKVEDYVPLVIMEDVDEEHKTVNVFPNSQIF